MSKWTWWGFLATGVTQFSRQNGRLKWNLRLNVELRTSRIRLDAELNVVM